jgi:Ca-activated chloride channel homolog
VDSTIAIQYPEFAIIDPLNFDSKLFKDVNVTFVLDISSSMKMGDRMELLKYSLNSLTENLRATDRLGIVTYSDDAQVFMTSKSGEEKESINNAVDELKPIGMTAGGKGIKLGYREQMKTFDPNKANIVIIITDGAFNRDSDSYQKIVKKYAKKGVVFSVVGIQSKPRDAVKLTEASLVGNGRFIAIDKLEDAHNKLFQEIRFVSYRNQ